MGSIWGRQAPGGPHVGPMNFAICDGFSLGQCQTVIWTNDDLSSIEPLKKHLCETLNNR